MSLFTPMPLMGLQVNITISGNTTDYNVFTAAGSPSHAAHINLTIESGVYVYSTAIATPGIDIGSGWAAGSRCTITNNGFILGKGGKGAHAPSSGSLTAPEAGGDALALRANCAVTVDNLNGTIGGGGGGGGGFRGTAGILVIGIGGGGGAGGGDGGSTFNGSSAATGGAGGGPGASGSNGAGVASEFRSGAGGGRILPGDGGAGAASGSNAVGGGAGGGGGVGTAGTTHQGGAGGAAENVGGNAVDSGAGSGAGGGGGGGGWGAAGGNPDPSSNVSVAVSHNGAAGGKCVALNGQTITWANNGTRYGAIS